MRSGAVILGIAVSAVLLAVAGGLYVLAGNNSGDGYRKSIDLVRQIQLLSSEWSMEVTRVKSDQFADFDSLAAFLPRMARLKDELADTAQRIPQLPDRVASDIQAYLNAIEAKEERIERFKTGYAVVRNSSRYLPLAATNVLQQAQNSRNDALVRNISSLIRDVNLYLATPTDTSRSRLTAEIKKLRESSVAYPPPLANALANLFSHAEVLVAKQGPTEELFKRATSGEVSDLTQQLSSNLQFELGKKTLLATYYDRGILVVFGALILFWILLALQQRIRGGSAATQVTSRPAAIEIAPAAGREMPATADAEEAVAAAEAAQPVPVAAEAIRLPEEPESLPAPAVPPSPEPSAESMLMQGFVVKCVAGIMAASAEEIAGRMDYLRRTQNRIQDAFRNGDGIAQTSDGTDVDEEIETISAIALSVRQRMNGIADLAKRLDSYSNGPANGVDRGMIDLNACVENVIETAGAENRATVVRNLGDIPEIFASRTEFQLLLSELIENSMVAVEGLDDRKGVIKVDTARKNDEILITVIDNGDGIAPDRRANIFKPFYTSREGAMGIGLTLAGHLAKKYEGVIKINSLPGQGTVARVTLPAGVSGA